MNDMADEKLDDLMDRYVFELLDEKSAGRVRGKIESDPDWQLAYEAAVGRKRALAAGVRPRSAEAPPRAASAGRVIEAVSAEPPRGLAGRLAAIVAAVWRGRATRDNQERMTVMRRIPARFWVLGTILIGLNAAGLLWIRHGLLRREAADVPRLRVAAALPSGEADQTDRLTLVFEQEIAQADQVGHAVTPALFVIDPAPPGKWVWAGRNRMEYLLDRPLPPGRSYTVRPVPNVEALTGRVLLDKSIVRFKTRALKLTGCQVIAVDRTHVTYELAFNQPVSPADVKRHTRVYESGEETKIGFRPLTSKPSARVVLRSRRPVKGRLSIVVSEKLTGVGAELGLGSRQHRQLAVSPEFGFVRCRVPTPEFQKQITVHLEFNRPLDRKQSLREVAVKPAVKDMTVSVSGRKLTLTGPFRPGARYVATVPGTLKTGDGQLARAAMTAVMPVAAEVEVTVPSPSPDAPKTDRQTLGEAKSVCFEVPDRQAGLRFGWRSGVLMPGGNLCLDVEAVNIPGVEFEVWRVHPKNVVPHLTMREMDEVTSPMRKRTVKLDLARNTVKKLAVDLDKLLEAPRGVYVIRAAAPGSRWNASLALVAVTDLGISVKHHSDGLTAWVTSLKTGKPLGGVTVTALTRGNLELASAVTGDDGTARLAVSKNHPDGEPFAVTALTGGDFSYLELHETRWMIDSVDQSGRSHPGAYEAVLYTDRGVYRPGETIHLTGIVRDQLGRVPPAFPLTVTAHRPDGREMARLPVAPDANGQGIFHVDIPTSENARTGRYEIEVALPGSAESLGATRTQVEAYVPLRMEVKAAPTAPRYGPGEKPKIDISARYLWDQPAADLAVNVFARFRPIAYKSKKYADYTFGDCTSAPKLSDHDADVKLDADGKATAEITAPHADPPRLLRAMVSATVTETGGRSVSSNTSAVIDPLDCHIGIRLSPRRVVAAGQPVHVEWVRLTGVDKPAAAGKMRLLLQRVEHDWIVKRVNGQVVWKSHERVISVLDRKLAAATATGQLEVTCPMPGTHRLSLADEATGSVTRVVFYASHASAGRESIPITRPEHVEILLDKKKYVPGEKARVVVRSPMSGTAWVTLETNEVIQHRVVPVAKNTAEVTLDVPRSLRGGAFVSVTVVRPIDPTKTKWMPHRAMGITRLVTDHRDHRMMVGIDAAETARPGETVEVSVDTGPSIDPERPAVVHLWAVDEGILLTTGFRTPDPHKRLLAQRRLAVATSDIFGLLLPDHTRAKGITRIGGDGEEDLDESGESRRRSNVPLRQRKPAIVWRKAMPVGADGRAVFRMPMPDIVGRMRLMAVAVDHDRYGSSELGVTLTTPMIVEATWPRFAAPGDVFDVPVKLFNSTKRSVTVALAVKATGPIRIEDAAKPRQVVVKPQRPATYWLRVKATGAGPVEAVVEGREVSSSPQPLRGVSKAKLAIRPAAGMHSRGEVHRIRAGEDLTLDDARGFIKGTVLRKIQIGPKPTVEFLPAIEQLIDYPYGCLEQTTSGLYPLLYAPDLLTARFAADARAPAVIDMVNAGIARLWSMQTNTGGLAYWPGGGEASLWPTAYATGFLLEARAAGYKIDKRFIAELANYLDEKLGDAETNSNMRAMICRLLAVCRRPRLGWMARLAERPDRLDIAGRAHLAGAYLAVGRKDRAQEVLGKDTLALGVTASTGGRITSMTRQQAVLLSVLLEIDPRHRWVPALVGRLGKARKDFRWGNTLENASALTALSRYQVLTEGDKPSFTGTVRTRSGKRAAFDQAKPLLLKLTAADGPVEIATKGKGNVYVAVTTEGQMPAEALAPYDRNLVVRRMWSDKRGKPIDPTKLDVGDLVYVTVTLGLPAKGGIRSAENVAVVDALPGGMEVENPRLASSARWASPSRDVPTVADRYEGKYSTTADRVEFLDDRVLIFTGVSRQARLFTYALRVTTSGEFAVPPIQASCMYDESVASLGKASRVTIRK